MTSGRRKDGPHSSDLEVKHDASRVTKAGNAQTRFANASFCWSPHGLPLPTLWLLVKMQFDSDHIDSDEVLPFIFDERNI